MTKSVFAVQEVRSWSDFESFVDTKDRNWIFRGQPKDDVLASTLERALSNWEIPIREGPEIEYQLIREFRRRLLDPIHGRINSDTLYCMALMRHYGAPVRLLDCTYSPFVAAKFAVEQGARGAVIYCFNGQWFEEHIVRLFGSVAKERRDDERRNDNSFRSMYQPILPNKRQQFVYHENPLYLNERLTIQQGVFLCSGDIGVSFLDNIKTMNGWASQENVVKLKLVLNSNHVLEFAEKLKRMNLSSAALFPGLDGFAKSLGEHMLHFRQMANLRTGLPDHNS
jgi:hypothetical protein